MKSRCLFVLLIALGFWSVVHAKNAAPPNIILIFTDDLGYGDLASYGHPTIRTPHLDKMAAEGMRFTDFYVAACVCTPSRAALLTGRLPVRSGMSGDFKHRVLYHDSPTGLPQEEITIAKALKSKGYATACIGKWHLGHLPQFQPTAHGFDSWFGLPYSNDMNPNPEFRKLGNINLNPDPKTEWWNVALMRNGEVLEKSADQPNLTRRYTEESIQFIKANKKKPFFLYVPHTFPHTPLFASDEFRGKSPRGIYGDVVEELDWSTGKILETLRKEKLADNTLVIFTSDNGPWLIRNVLGGSAGLLRDGKGSTWEGGMRVPMIAWWPGKIPAGVVNRDQANAMDLFTTCLKLANVPIPTDRVIDGVDLSAALFGKGPTGRDIQYYYRGEELFALRKGPFKAHFKTGSAYGNVKMEEHNPPVLYHLGHDPSEQYDVAEKHPEVIADILREKEAHLSKLVRGKPRVHRGGK